MERLIILNSAVMPIDGNYNKKSISKNRFINLIKNANDIKSSIGYESVSEIIYNMTGIKIQVDRNITVIPEGYNVIGLTLDYRMNPESKGVKNPTEDDYTYFMAYYTK
jgi:hypothetical protein